MKLPLPKKVVSKDSLYVVVHQKYLIVVYTNNTGVVWYSNEKEQEELSPFIGVWVQKKASEYTLCTTDLDFWSKDLCYMDVLDTEEIDKKHQCFTEILDSAMIPSKLRYKQPFTLRKWLGMTLIHFPKYPNYVYIQAGASQSILEAFTESTLDSSILLVHAEDHDSLWQFTTFLKDAGEVLSIDTETYDPDEPNGWKALVGFLCCIRTLQVYSPLLDKTFIVDFGRRGFYVNEETRFAFGSALQNAINKREVIFQNSLFDLHVLDYQLKCTFYHAKIRDTMSMSKQVWAGIGQIRHGLDDICDRTGVGIPDKSLQKSDFGAMLVPGQYNYGAQDTEFTYKAKLALDVKLKEIGGNELFAKIDNAYSNVAHMIRRYGLYIDTAKLDEIYRATESYYKQKEGYWTEATGLPVTVSPKALLADLSDRGITAPNAQKGTLKELVEKYPPIQDLLDAKIAKKRLDYLSGIKANMGYRKDGCATPGIRVSATQGLGRTSQGDLVRGKNVAQNFQNMGRELREYPELPDYRVVFAAPPGYKFCSIDLCLDLKATKVLVVNKGIIPLGEVREGDVVYGWDATKNQVVKTPVKQTIQLAYSGDMYKWKGTYMSQRMTTGHRIPLRDGRYVYPEEVAAQEQWRRGEGFSAQKRSIKVSDLITCANAVEGGTNPHNLTEADVRLMVAMAADGYYPKASPRSCVFYGSRQDKLDRHINLLQNSLGWKASVTYTPEWLPKYGWRITYFAGERLKMLRDLMPDKALPRLLIELPVNLREIAFEEIAKWDGCEKGEGTHFEWSSVREQEAHVVVELAVSLGYKATITSRMPSKGKQIAYRVRITKKGGVKSEGVRHTSPLWGKRRGTKQPLRRYEKYSVTNLPVGCLKTGTTNFYVVTEDGKTELTGNCGSHGRLAIYYAGCEGAIPTLAPGQDIHCYNASFIAKEAEPKTSPYYPALKAYPSLLTLRHLEEGEPLPEKLTMWLEHLTTTHPEFKDWAVEDVCKDLKKAAKYYREIAKTSFYTAINFGGAKRLQGALKSVGIVLDVERCKVIMDALWLAIGEIRDFVKAKQKETNRMQGWKPEELKLLNPEEIDWDDYDEAERAALKKRPVEFGHLVTECGFTRYIPKYYQTGWKGKSYISTSITDVSASCWQPPEAKVIKMTQIRLLHEYIIPNHYHIVKEGEEYPLCWIANNVHDEVILIAHESIALQAATIQKEILDEEWEKVCPGILGTEGSPEDCLGNNWGETK